jgi:aerobic-type carbon monoxide dehydrogenase small subunit (CoxS/CutS family)
MKMIEKISMTVNGRSREVATEPERPLLDVLREELQLTGAKYGCGEGQCGACTVLVDGRRTYSCRVPVGQVAGKDVLTIEGLASPSKLHPVQEAFLAEDAYQCGYCIPGMIMAAVAFLAEKPKPSDAEIVSGMNRQLCRCCGYDNIVAAVRRAAERGA